MDFRPFSSLVILASKTSLLGDQTMQKTKEDASPIQPHRVTTRYGTRDLVIETGRLAMQANGSVTCRLGDTIILAAATMAPKPLREVDYFPLMVDYQEKLYAAGKIKTSRFVKREGKPSDEAILSGRVIDRSIRPLFPSYIVNDVQVVVDVLCVDGENDSDIPSIIGASAALSISDIPFEKIIAACRVGRVQGNLVLNPSFEARKKSDLDLIVSVTEDDRVIMLEGKAKEIPDEIFFEAITFAKKHAKKVIDLIRDFQKKAGKKKIIIPKPKVDPKIEEEVKKIIGKRFDEILYLKKKLERKKEIARLQDEVREKLILKFGEENEKAIKSVFVNFLESVVREKILKEEKRIGNRKLDEVRSLDVQVGLLPRTHGSGYFMRGETQILTVTTLGAPSHEQIIEDMEEEYKKRFIHHYNFPPYSVGEVGLLRGPSRRDIGHGALVEKSLENLVPTKEEFPYTIRLVSEVLGSNGSSSMASVCASSLALMDAGVPVKAACAGIALGLASDKSGRYKILTDLQDLEDIEGGMDFKIAGTSSGITVCQMDTKTDGLSDEIISKTISQSRKAREQILKKMNEVLSRPRPQLSPYAPRIIAFRIDPEKIRDVIGPQGKMINEIIDQTGVEIDIEDDGLVEITSVDEKAAQKALSWIKEITRDVKVGEVFTGKVTRIANFGVFVELHPRMEGLIHVSNLKQKGIYNLNREFNIGDIITVKVLEISPDGKVRVGFVKK